MPTSSIAREFIKISSDLVGPFEIIPLIWQDDEQFLWLHLGPKGYVKYDGAAFREVRQKTGDPLSVVHATAALVDGDELWIATRDGLNRFNVRTQNNKLYKATEWRRSHAEGIPDNLVSSALRARDGTKWFIGQNSVFKFDDNTETFAIVLDNKSSIETPLYTGAFDADEQLWVYRIDKDLIIIDPVTGNQRQLIPGKDIPEDFRFIEAMHGFGEEMLVSTPAGLWALNIKSRQVRQLFPKVIHNVLSRLTTDKFGNLWAAGTSVFKISPTLDSIDSYSIGTGQDIVATLFADYEGNIWAGGAAFGLYKYTATGQEADVFDPFAAAGVFTRKERIHEVVANNNDIWIATTSGLIKSEPIKRTAKRIATQQFDAQVRVLTQDAIRNVIWAADDRKLIAVDNDGEVVFHEDLSKWFSFDDADSRIFSIAADKFGNLWLSHGRTIAYYQPASRKMEIEPAHLPQFIRDSGYVQIVSMEGGKKVIFSAYGYGIFLLDVESKTTKAYTSLSHPLIKEDIWATTRQAQNVFVTYGDGTTTILNTETGELSALSTPLSGVACAVNADTEWLLVQLGGFVHRWTSKSEVVRRLEIDAPADFKTALGTACAIDRYSNLVVATHAGLLVVPVNDAVQRNKAMPQTSITDIKINGQSAMISNATSAALAADADHVELFLSVMSLANPATNQLRYRLIGHHDWVESSENQRSVIYTHLPAGSYRFEVEGRNRGGEWGPVRQLTITKAHYWYWSLFAKLVYLGLGLLILITIIRFWMSRQRERFARESAERKSRELSEFAAFKERFFLWVSHDLRTPLTPIALECEALTEAQLPQTSEASVGRIRQAARHLQDLVEGLLDVAKLKHGGAITTKLSATSVKGLVEEVINWMQREVLSARGKEIALVFDAELPTYLMLDERRIRQILGNLVSNAVKIVPADGGQIVLDVRYEARALVIRVRDNGKGIDAELMPRLFGDFHQAADASGRGGFGLGLSGSRHFANSMGGTLVVESTGPTGTAMCLTVPAVVATGPATVSVAKTTNPIKLPLRALVVDDSAVIRETLTALLTPHLEAVTAVATVEEAESAIESEAPHVLILDYELGADTETGMHFLYRLRANNCAVPTILLTGAPNELTGDTSLAQVVMSKPPRKRELLDAIVQIGVARSG